ncbi:ferredoxin domain-containing protein [Hippea maritima]|uniref:DUF2148 domain-containing protein n=1 Tax=Hippea maritima (strain ATCC 700847 / DSM 10411 / MH2) TaxID=760142 RepID=F2LVW9_HIPMA|nr:DUF2148 domain-containing protein [Hippea maritima]AEA33903.1 Protein of unknown function DUF2148 [Hippea maritima DSM 10411]
MNIISDALDVVSKFLLVDAITAPKSVGRDDIVVDIVRDDKTKVKILQRMKEITENGGKSFYKRDAINIENIDFIILIGFKVFYHGFDCGFCGFSGCEECESKGGMCAVSATDCGIAIGSLVKLASIFGVDNRIMISIGQAAKEIGYFKEKIGGAYGIPLSATTKNPFFDRKIKV